MLSTTAGWERSGPLSRTVKQPLIVTAHHRHLLSEVSVCANEDAPVLYAHGDHRQSQQAVCESCLLSHPVESSVSCQCFMRTEVCACRVQLTLNEETKGRGLC